MQTAGTEMPGVEYRNVRRDSALNEGIWLDTSPVFMESAWKMRYRITLHQLREEASRGTERDSPQRTKKSTCLRWRMMNEREIFLSSLHFNTVLQMPLKDGVERWQNSKGMGVRLGDYEFVCLTILACCWRRVPVHYFAGAASKSDVRLQTEYLSV